MSGGEIERALGELDAITRRLRRECPWDREQDERSIVPHTVEEAYELADAVHRADDARMLDELGDVLFQVHFLSLLLEERGAGDLAAVADHCRAKLIARHPHVFGAAPDDLPAGPRPEHADGVLRNWEALKRREAGREAGPFGEVPANLPALLHARKLQRRAASAGVARGGLPEALAGARERLEELAAGGGVGAFDGVGELLFAVVDAARELRVDPELALRQAAERFRERVESGAHRAASPAPGWHDASPHEQPGPPGARTEEAAPGPS